MQKTIEYMKNLNDTYFKCVLEEISTATQTGDYTKCAKMKDIAQIAQNECGFFSMDFAKNFIYKESVRRLLAHYDDSNDKQTHIKCQNCNYLNKERYYTLDSFEMAFDWFCEHSNVKSKKIAGYVGIFEEDRIYQPCWCPLLQSKKPD